MTITMDIETLKALQQQLKWEDEHDNNYQETPRFWVIKDYRKVPANEDYTTGSMEYFYSDGDYVAFDTVNELQSFLKTEYEGVKPNDDATLQELMALLHDDATDFDTLWDYVMEHLNEHGFFSSCWMAEEDFIQEDTLFLTKQEAQRHLALHSYHYSSKAHTYAMTASPQLKAVVTFLMQVDFNQLQSKKTT